MSPTLGLMWISILLSQFHHFTVGDSQYHPHDILSNQMEILSVNVRYDPLFVYLGQLRCHIRLFGVLLADSFVRAGVLLSQSDGGEGSFGQRSVLISKFTLKGSSNRIVGEVRTTLNCWLTTNKNYISQRIENPMTLSMMAYCPVPSAVSVVSKNRPVSLDGKAVCSRLKSGPANYTMLLSSSPQESSLLAPVSATYQDRPPHSSSKKPFGKNSGPYRFSSQHAVCTVQVFRNPMTGPKLFLFVKYYLSLGWGVVVYDRFGAHREFIADLINRFGPRPPCSSLNCRDISANGPWLQYHPYTAMQLVQPSKYNDLYLRSEATGFREYDVTGKKNMSYQVADTLDQDSDKMKTYDLARASYWQLRAILFADSDEFVFCPEADKDAHDQITTQHGVIHDLRTQGVDEIRIERYVYYALPSRYSTHTWRDVYYDINHTAACMRAGYDHRNMTQMFQCFSGYFVYQYLSKSVSVNHARRSICPFHWNHWRCTLHNYSGSPMERDKIKCFCDTRYMTLTDPNRPEEEFNKCHIIHLNGNGLVDEKGRSREKQRVQSMFEPFAPLISVLWSAERNLDDEKF